MVGRKNPFLTRKHLQQNLLQAAEAEGKEGNEERTKKAQRNKEKHKQEKSCQTSCDVLSLQ